MSKRPIIKIDEEKCNGCGNCVVDCEEGALEIIDGKAKLVNEIFCDGLGDCIGSCPTGALTIERREAEEFDPEAVKEHVNKNQNEEAEKLNSTSCSCPGERMQIMNRKQENNNRIEIESQLQNWPIQIHLLPQEAPYFNNADLLITADCVPVVYGNYHQALLAGKTAVMGCPKLDDASAYVDKLTAIIENHDLNSITIARMEVPCCSGLIRVLEEALHQAGMTEKDLKIEVITVKTNGEIKE